MRTPDDDLLLANVQVTNDPTQPVPVQLDRYGRNQSGSSVPVVLATDHDPVPVTSASLPLVGGALDANGAVFGPIPLAGCGGVVVQISGTYSLTIIFEATVADPVLGRWVTVSGARTSNGQIDSNPAVNSVTVAWDFFLAGQPHGVGVEDSHNPRGHHPYGGVFVVVSRSAVAAGLGTGQPASGNSHPRLPCRHPTRTSGGRSRTS